MGKRVIDTAIEDNVLEPLVCDIKERVMDCHFSLGITPSEVVDWAEDIYDLRISTKTARGLIIKARIRAGVSSN